MVDLTQFSSREDALEKIKPRSRYVEMASDAVLPIPTDMGMNVSWLFWLSAIARAQGLHSAIAREAQETNPHAVIPLIRTFAETVVLVMYVNDFPDYIDTLTVDASELPKGGPKRRSIQALINHASQHATQIKDVYRQLSEGTHFGALAMWTSHIPEEDGEGGRKVSWSSEPRWRDDEQALIACALTLELAEAMEATLRIFARRHILPLKLRALSEQGTQAIRD